MSVSGIVRHFEALGKIPVTIEDVLEQIKNQMPLEHIEIHGLDVPVSYLRGQYLRFLKPHDGLGAMLPTYHSMVNYSTRQTPAEQRLVVCKELIHILDEKPVVTSTMEAVVAQARQIAHRQMNPKQSLQGFFDELAKYKALAILFPYGVREELIKRGIENLRICELLQLPPLYVEMVMTEQWPHLRQTILAYA